MNQSQQQDLIDALKQKISNTTLCLLVKDYLTGILGDREETIANRNFNVLKFRRLPEGLTYLRYRYRFEDGTIKSMFGQFGKFRDLILPTALISSTNSEEHIEEEGEDFTMISQEIYEWTFNEQNEPTVESEQSNIGSIPTIRTQCVKTLDVLTKVVKGRMIDLVIYVDGQIIRFPRFINAINGDHNGNETIAAIFDDDTDYVVACPLKYPDPLMAFLE